MPSSAVRNEEMARDELHHAAIEHEFAVREIEKLNTVYTPPEGMLEKWQKAHREYVEQAVWVRQMLEM